MLPPNSSSTKQAKSDMKYTNLKKHKHVHPAIYYMCFVSISELV